MVFRTWLQGGRKHNQMLWVPYFPGVIPLSPTSKPTINFFTSAILLFGGSFSGTHLTNMVAPYSQWSGLVGFLMFPIAFMASMQLWSYVSRLVARVAYHSKPGRNIRKTTPLPYHRTLGAITFVLTSIAISILSGPILTPPAMQIAVDPGYKMLIPAGAMYGIICWICIQLGYLQQADA